VRPVLFSQLSQLLVDPREIARAAGVQYRDLNIRALVEDLDDLGRRGHHRAPVGPEHDRGD
jgi:hypothetical protein